MFNGTILDIEGISAAHMTNTDAKTGCTFILCKEGAVGSVDVRGGAPGTRETDAIRPGGVVPNVHGVILAGGSAFGLAAADGAMKALEEAGIGFDSGFAKVPIVGSAVLFDLGVGRADIRPDFNMGYLAARAALENNQVLEQGAVGAGTGATVAKFLGPAFARPSGIGSASMKAGDATVAAVFAVNALGSIFNHQTGEMLEGIRDDNGEFINPFASPENALPGTNTTIGVIATDAVLDKLQAQRLAMLAHDGLAMAIRPVHTMYDGDTAFSLATCKKKADVDQIFSLAAEVTARAICNAVLYGRG